MSTVYTCQDCHQHFYEAEWDKHACNPIVYTPEGIPYQEVPRSRETLIHTLIHEYGLGVDTIAVLTGGQ